MKQTFISALLVLCLGTTVKAELVNEPIACGTDATYYPLGYLWAAQPPIETNAIMIHHADRSPSVGSGSVISALEASEAVQRAFDSWVAAECGGSTPNILVNSADALYTGGDRGDVWQGTNLVSHKNVILWDDSGDYPGLSAGTVAFAETQFFVATGFAVDGDMLFNTRDFTFRTQAGGVPKGCSDGEQGCYDIESVALHEAGHFFGFGHVDCSDSVMYPTGSGTAGNQALTLHETAGACSLYPPRAEGSTRASGERCSTDAQCPNGYGCIEPAGASGYGMCLEYCGSNSDCDAGFVCVSESVGTSADLVTFCRPGLAEQTATTELCTPCTGGADCSSGFCLSDGTNQFCSQGCLGPEDCPTGFECIASSVGSGCWPLDPDNCGEDTRGILGDICFVESGASDGGDYYNGCRPGLSCFIFKPKCGGRSGACVLYCDEGTDCPDDNLQCCFGVDDAGNCLSTATQSSVGGCFDIRSEGQSCVSAENSVCGGTMGCFYFGAESTRAQCYETCTTSADCSGPETCSAFSDDGCGNAFSLCCADSGLPDACLAGESESLLELGMRCSRNAECASGLCLKYQGDAACSRSCEPVTNVGCPGDETDIDGDGVADGGFDCLDFSGRGQCWPRSGPLGDVPTQTGAGAGNVEPASGGCCSAAGPALPLSSQIPNLLVWLPALWIRFRRKTRRV